MNLFSVKLVSLERNNFANFSFSGQNGKLIKIPIFFENNTIRTEVVSNEFKLPVHWSSKIPKRYKRNIINGELHRMREITSDFEEGLTKIREKYNKAGYPIRFVNSVISSFTKDIPIHQTEDISRIVRLLSNSDTRLSDYSFPPSTPLFFKEKLLKVQDIFKIRIAKFIYTSLNKTSPANFHLWFKLTIQVHNHNTRSQSAVKNGVSKVNSAFLWKCVYLRVK